MDPVTIVLGVLAVALALLAFMQRMRVGDLEEQVRQLEAKLADRLPPPPEDPEPEPEEDEADEEEDEPEEDEPEEDEPEEEEEDEPEDEPEEDEPEEEEADEPEEDEPEEDEPEEREDVPVERKAEPPAREAPPEPDPLRLKALEQVQQAFETCRYLDFDAIVEKPSTYRVTVPLTAANGAALRYLEDGMFPCLKQVRIEGSNAVLHIDTSLGPP